MMTSEETLDNRYLRLATTGVIPEAEFFSAVDSARARGIELEYVLIHEKGVPKDALLSALSDYYGYPSIQYDERMPIPPCLLEGLDDERLYYSRWFPVIEDGNTVIVAAADPRDPEMREQTERAFPGRKVDFMVALSEEILWFIQDYLHARPGLLIGTERTNLAYWRNTLAQWRTRLACYRTDLARARTDLASLRSGLGLVTISDVLMKADKAGNHILFNMALLLGGFAVAVYGLMGYLKTRRPKMRQPGHHTLVEVTAATVCFLEGYHFIEGGHAGEDAPTKKTMLARISSFMGAFSTILYPSPASKERTHLARERNVLAAGRTVDACFRTVYARARTGLAFIRTGVTFTSIGLGLAAYYGLSARSVLDLAIIASGALLIADGVRWYMPVRREQAGLSRCPAG